MNAEIIIFSLLISIFLLVSGYWFIVFNRKIYLARRYKRTAWRNITEDNTDYIGVQYYHHYQTEICKYIMLLLINVSEVFVGISYYIQTMVEDLDFVLEEKSMLKEELENCTSLNNSMLIDFQYKETFLLLSMFRSFGNAVYLFIPALGICLMNYLIWRMKNMNSKIMNIKRFIFILSMTSLFIFITSFFTVFII